ncbi:uncharacterized protein LOC110100068 [Dendrobium catenatum]|uniref:uncharacterized protein LOC110100068 n=1 Tax=Dendrobium catenatum TaxID=906689 RepID=UPI0009F704A1|nr:uncharacterized protein LOC110100068 [Dendrobium catenatum]
MECVLNVRFSIILNGKKIRWIEACSGFHQGCPLSPYLFIMCAQLLSNALLQRGHSLGIQVASKGPRITHLLYVDDVLIFSQANCKLARHMMEIIEDFCKWTGLKVNANKSQILFAEAIERARRKKLTRILGFKAVNEWKYLGIKMSLKRLKVADFQDLLAQVLERLNVWGKKNLSLGGRIVLLKSSLLTLPNFVIMHSVVPRKVLQEIEKLCRNFVWHKSNGERGLHYVAWEELCKPRSAGGLGLQSCIIKSGTLKAIISLNYIQNLDSLLHRSLNAKYSDNILDGTYKHNFSNAWKIMSEGGNVDLEGKKVQQLLTNDGRWDDVKFRLFFHQDLAWLIKKVNVDRDGGRDMLEPCKKLSGCSVSSLAFKAAMNKRYNAKDNGFYDWQRKLKLNVKVELFWWRLSKFANPSNSFLKFRRLAISDSCVRGCYEAENYKHIVIRLVKVNVDSSLLSNYRAGIGGIFRDWKRRMLLAFGRNSLHWDIAQLEMEYILALRDFIQGWMLETVGIIIESDNINVINYIQQSMKKTDWHLEESLNNKLFFLNDFNKIVFHHVSRNCNKVADFFATLALDGNFLFDSSSFGSIPSTLLDLIKKDGYPFIYCK